MHAVITSEYIAGIDIGGTNIRCSVVSANDPTSLLVHRASETPVSNDLEAFLDFIANEVSLCLKDAGIKREALLAVGCSVPGVVDVRLGTVVAASNLGWTNVPLVELLSRRFGRVVAVENDVRAAAMAEYAEGAGRGCSSLGYLTVSTGVSVGIVQNGTLLRGHHQAAGEIAYMVPDPRHVDQDWGVNGCLEMNAAGVGLARAWAAHLGVRPTDVSAADVFDAARAGDDAAVALVDRAATYIAQAAVAIGTIIDPEILVLGGSIAQYQSVIIDRVREVTDSMLPFPPRVVPAQLGGDAPLIGALTIAADGIRSRRDRALGVGT